MAKDIVEIVLSLVLIGACMWLFGCVPPNNAMNGSVLTPGQQYNAAEDQWLADWQLKNRITDLEMRQLHDDLQYDEDDEEE